MRGRCDSQGALPRRLLRVVLGAWGLPIAVASSGCAHTQQPERRIYFIAEDAGGVGGSGGRDCDAEHIQCFDKCWNTAPPLTSIKVGSGKHHEYCTEKCREAFMECIEAQERSAQEMKKAPLRFSSIDGALGWLREHKSEVAIGTVVLIAGVAFVVTAGAAGALVLAPVAF